MCTLSPISETDINVNAAVKPDFASASKTAEGPPFKVTIRENASMDISSTPAIDNWYRTPERGFSLPSVIC